MVTAIIRAKGPAGKRRPVKVTGYPMPDLVQMSLNMLLDLSPDGQSAVVLEHIRRKNNDKILHRYYSSIF